MSSRYLLFQAGLNCTVVAMLVIVPSGCSSKIPTFPARGKVVYKETGKPVAGGGLVIWFESTTPPYHRSSSEVDSEGKFELGLIHAGGGTIEGEHRIRFTPANPGGASAQEALAKRMNGRYYEYSTSGLKQTIAKTANDFVIEVEGPSR